MPGTQPRSLGHPREALASCLMGANAVYLQLLDAATSQQYKEAGKTVRCLARCLAEIEQFDSNDFEVSDAENDALETDESV